MVKKLFIGLGVLFTLSVATSWTGIPAAFAVFIWTVALPWAAALQ